MKPLISVVMASYNETDHLEKAVQSILNQSFHQFEFIIVDDGSTDESVNIVETLPTLDCRIRVIHNSKNQGLAASLNTGIRAAKSPYILRMDADDIARPDRIKKQYNFMMANPHIDVLGSAMSLINAKGVTIGAKNLPSSHEEIICRAFHKTLVFHPTILIKKNVFEEFGYYDENLRWAEDADLWLRLYDKITFHNLPEPLLFYRIRPRLSFKVIRQNLAVKFINLKRRRLLLSKGYVLFWDLISSLPRLFHNKPYSLS